MMFLIFVTIMLIGMIWSGLGYSGGALLFAILLAIGGWAVLIFWAGSKSPDADPKQNHTSPHSAKSAHPASSSRPASSTRLGAYGGHAAAGTGNIGRIGADDKWDNSDEAGGLPRAISPFSDIDDPYERMVLEDEMFREDFEMLSGGDPFGGGWFGDDD